MIEENRCQSRGDLLDDIKRGSTILEQQLSRFIYWIGDRKIVSFVEMQQTKKLQKVCEIKHIYPSSRIRPKWAMATVGFPTFISSSSQSRPHKSARKYMQGPVKAQYPNPPHLPLQQRRDKTGKNSPHRVPPVEAVKSLPLINFRSFKPNLSQLPGPLTDGAQQPDKTWARTGEHITLVSKDSALLGLQQAVEEIVAVEADHSMMVKFNSRNNPGYIKALDSLYRFEKEPKAVMERHFCSGE